MCIDRLAYTYVCAHALQLVGLDLQAVRVCVRERKREREGVCMYRCNCVDMCVCVCVCVPPLQFVDLNLQVTRVWQNGGVF